MLVHLSFFSLSLWLAILTAQVGLAFIVRRSNDTRHPVFAWYSYVYAAGSVCCFLVAATLPPIYYFYAYMAATISGDLLILFVALEVYSLAFGPATALPPMVPFKTRTMVGTAFSLAIAAGAALRVLWGGEAMRFLIKTEQVLSILAWAVFMILLTYSRMLRIAWPRKTAGIAFGFILCLSTNIAAVFFRALGGIQLVTITSRIGMLAYLAALIGWSFCFLEKEQTAVITREQCTLMKDGLAGSLELLSRSGVQVKVER